MIRSQHLFSFLGLQDVIWETDGQKIHAVGNQKGIKDIVLFQNVAKKKIKVQLNPEMCITYSCLKYLYMFQLIIFKPIISYYGNIKMTKTAISMFNQMQKFIKYCINLCYPNQLLRYFNFGSGWAFTYITQTLWLNGVVVYFS